MNQPNTHPRIASLDFQRGLAIWLMVILHSLEHSYDFRWIIEEPQRALTLPPIVLVIGGLVGYFASWNSYFLLISATVNTLSMTRNAARGIKPTRVLSKQLVTGCTILLIGTFVNGFLYDGYLGAAIRTGDWHDLRPLTNGVFSMYTLQMIGWSMMIGGFIHYLLMMNGGGRKAKRSILVYVLLALLVIMLSPVVHGWVDGMPWEVPTTLPKEYTMGDHSGWPSVHVQAANASLKAWFFAVLAGDLEPVFPYLATWFAGSALGLALLGEATRKKLFRVAGPAAAGMIIMGILFITTGSVTLGNTRPATGNYLLMLGGQLAVMLLFLWLVEYRGDPAVFANRRAVRALRLWAMTSLTIWSLEILELLPRALLGSVYNTLSPQKVNTLRHGFLGQGQEHIALLIGIFVMASFHVLVVVWSRFDFKYSFEWFVIRMASIGSGAVSRRLDVEYMMNRGQWARFGPGGARSSQEQRP